MDARRYLPVVLFIAIFLYPSACHALGWVEDSVTARDKRYWENLEKAKSNIKARADEFLVSIGYDAREMSVVVFPKGEGGDELWTVKYWSTPPNGYTEEVVSKGDLEVYLNYQGKVRRVMKLVNGQQVLIHGNDQRINRGMTFAQVREHLGEPDITGKPPRWARRLDFDVEWVYRSNSERRVTITVYFKDGVVENYAKVFE